MSRIFKDDDFILDLERVSLIKKRPLSTESYIYMEGQCIALDRDLCKKVKNAWEEYMKDKEPNPTIEELQRKLVEKDYELHVLKANMDGIMRSFHR